ncbi:MAG TPA: hypothetical protein VN426_06130 [Syntrophomonadaceae bacterium]|nr:hypothetical protein [Syntrophomonadaceae bacterium]
MDQMVYGPLELPSGKQISFRAPLGSDRTNVLQMCQISSENAVSDAIVIDDYMAAKCLTEVDGKTADGDYKRLFENWSQKDILYYRTVYEEMFGLNVEARDKAKEAAAFLLKGQTSTAGCS